MIKSRRSKELPEKRILVVDDEKKLTVILDKFLSDKGYDVDVAFNGRKAKTLARKHGYNLVIMDIKMPVEDGEEVIYAIEKMRPGTKILILSGYPLSKTLYAKVQEGVYTYSIKPFDNNQLLQTIKGILKEV